MRRTLTIALALAFLLVGLTPSAVFAGTQGSCPLSDETKVLLYENKAGDTRGGNDRLWRCSDNSDLALVTHTLDGACGSGIIELDNDWNDCVGSVQAWIPLGYRIDFFRDAGYGTRILCLTNAHNGNRVNIDLQASWADDTLSSFRWVQSASC